MSGTIFIWIRCISHKIPQLIAFKNFSIHRTHWPAFSCPTNAIFLPPTYSVSFTGFLSLRAFSLSWHLYINVKNLAYHSTTLPSLSPPHLSANSHPLFLQSNVNAPPAFTTEFGRRSFSYSVPLVCLTNFPYPHVTAHPSPSSNPA